ncbi:signal peptidase I [Planobispora takensis]|uniref:signal peptidase I n=1 Tax=Planobispora takensis TaxID=1367882 RepID=UPI001941847D|nr:signal peptidase I [Planobispora takensis]
MTTHAAFPATGRPDVRALVGAAWPAAALAVRTVRGVIVILMLASLVPMLFGWHSQVILSGSMTPKLHPGDVVLVQPADASAVRPGQIVLVDDPARPGTTLIHRVVALEPGGSLTTKGDANPGPDSTPVPASSVIGLPRLLIPYVGLPSLWLHEGALGKLALAALLALALASLPTPADDSRPGAFSRGRRRR